MERIFAGVFGSGLGHISRTHAIASELRQSMNIEFLYSTFDEALDYLKSEGESVVESPSLGVKWNIAGGFSGSETIVRFPLYMFTFSKQVAFEIERIRKFNPRAVISDSRLSTLIAAKSRFYPVVTILNQFKVLFPPRFRMNALSHFYERIEGDVLGLLWSLSNTVLFPDLPPPFTLGEANIAGTDVSNKVKFTGFMSSKIKAEEGRIKSIRDLLGFDKRPVAFIQISGPEATKPHFIETALLSADRLSENFNLVISKGHPFGSDVPSKLRNGGWLYEWCPIKDELFVMSDVVVARAGHTTLSQCIECAKPAVIVPIYNHSEQIWNADKFQKLGLGLEIRSEYLREKNLAEALLKCYERREYKENMVKIKEISDRYDGIKNAVEAVKEFL